ncbi:MAG TPA: acyl-ACP--UDP-N-acetylglucosamine O-acyltransferase [Dissulfurispiraceae bacterium]|nr:acyl-ACP--UDP-N-acetylglucosamine O-acyltransferase [Dissulfurispiraceae bacterium]
MPIDIHPTAIVSPKAELADSVKIGPYCTIGDAAVLGAGTTLISHVVLDGNITLGNNCTVYPFACLGTPPQDIKYNQEPTKVRIGDNNIFREYVTIHRATIHGEGQTTVIGNNNYLMAYCHVGHDCAIGNNVFMANGATLGGHVQVFDRAVIGGIVAVHQFTRIGAYAMLGGFSGIGQDLPPYTMASGARASLYGLNAIGLKRNGFSDETIAVLKKAYRILFRDKLTLKDALEKVKNELPSIPELAVLTEFIETNKRGICR